MDGSSVGEEWVRGFGELETVIMDRVWDLGRVTTVREVFERLVLEREIAYTTVLSTMDNLHRKGWLSRERDGKAFRYWASLSREEHSARLMRDALDGGGNPDLVLTRFLEQMSEEDTARLRDVVRKRARSRGRGRPRSSK